MAIRFGLTAFIVMGLWGAAPATAQDETSPQTPEIPALAWTQNRDKMIAVDSSDAGDGADFYTFSRVLKSSGGAGPLVILNCSFNSRGNYALSAGFQLDPANTYEENPKTRLRTNTLSGHVTVGDDKTAERFVYHAASSKVVPRDPAVARRLFNAVVKNKPVTLKIKGKTHQIALPQIDDTFTKFVKICPVTNGGEINKSVFDQALSRANAMKAVR